MSFCTLGIDPQRGTEGGCRFGAPPRGQGYPTDREMRSGLAGLELERALGRPAGVRQAGPGSRPGSGPGGRGRATNRGRTGWPAVAAAAASSARPKRTEGEADQPVRRFGLRPQPAGRLRGHEGGRGPVLPELGLCHQAPGVGTARVLRDGLSGGCRGVSETTEVAQRLRAVSEGVVIFELILVSGL